MRTAAFVAILTGKVERGRQILLQNESWAFFIKLTLLKTIQIGFSAVR